MSALLRPQAMTLAEFLAWEAGQTEKHEFVDGRIVAMAGATMVHNRVAANVLRHLGNKLAGKPCQPFGSDAKLISPTGRSRYPDVQVDCGRHELGQTHTTDPRVVIEVLSPSNDWIDIAERRADYQAHSSVRHVLFIASQKPWAQLMSREGEAWREVVLTGLEGEFALPAIEAQLAMAEIYEGVAFEEEGAQASSAAANTTRA